MWFRAQYNLLPMHVISHRDMTILDVRIERERFLVMRGAEQKSCPSCKVPTFEDFCPMGCEDEHGEPLDITQDELLNNLISRAEKEQAYDLDALFPARPRPVQIEDHSEEDWVPEKA